MSDDPIERLIARLDSPDPPALAPALPDDIDDDTDDGINALFARLESPAPDPLAPAWPEDEAPEGGASDLAAPLPPPANDPSGWRRWSRAGAGLAVVAGLALAVLVAPDDGDPRFGTRGGEAAVAVTMDLTLARDGASQRIADGDSARVGDAIYFTLTANPASDLALWVEGPVGLEEIARASAGVEGEMLQSDAGYVAYLFEQPGSYAFFAGVSRDEPGAQVQIDVP